MCVCVCVVCEEITKYNNHESRNVSDKNKRSFESILTVWFSFVCAYVCACVSHLFSSKGFSFKI